jgi:hydrogenase maturation protease
MDDGVGVHLARKLRARGLGPRVQVVEAGTALLDVLHLMERCDCIIAVDAMRAGGAPGTVYRLSCDDVQRAEQVSMHDFTFKSAVGLLRKPPGKICFLGVEPEQIDYGLELTPAVARALEPAAEAVLCAIREFTQETCGQEV